MTAPQDPRPPRKSRVPLIVVLSIVVLLAVGGVVAVVVATSGNDTTQGTPMAAPRDDTDPAVLRDAAIEDGTSAAETLNTLDYREAEEGMKRWESVATGEFRAELEKNRDESVAVIKNARSVAVGKAETAALADLDPTKGTARLLVVVRVEITRDGVAGTPKQTRISLSLEETKDGWKVSAINQK